MILINSIEVSPLEEAKKWPLSEVSGWCGQVELQLSQPVWSLVMHCPILSTRKLPISQIQPLHPDKERQVKFPAKNNCLLMHTFGEWNITSKSLPSNYIRTPLLIRNASSVECTDTSNVKKINHDEFDPAFMSVMCLLFSSLSRPCLHLWLKLSTLALIKSSNWPDCCL